MLRIIRPPKPKKPPICSFKRYRVPSSRRNTETEDDRIQITFGSLTNTSTISNEHIFDSGQFNEDSDVIVVEDHDKL